MSLAHLKDRDRRQKVARAFEVRRFIVPGIEADRISSRGGCLDVGRELLELSHQMKAEGLRLGWHNGGAELVPIAARERPIDLLLESVPELEWECDLGWLASAGVDPAAELRTNGRRITALHMRDVSGPEGDPKQKGGADIGSGVLEWKAIRASLNQTRVDLLVMEHDHAQDVSGFLNRSIDFLDGWMTSAAIA
ncbi:sugar phosphate isomerase/epimerase [Rhizobium sp. BK251]|uniref:sugar phosphate isomerase/epimerase family protein n=1 Tax=Rhizobium sp. BK251 TaxID=2512125 RepID=UPI001A9CC4DA|nr:sugar phosphate isomerase/epimerase [Rhizobium sp. BK251]